MCEAEGFVADEAVYQRVVRDLAAITLENDELSAHTVRMPHDGRTIKLSYLEASVFDMMQTGSYVHWDCVHEYLGMEEITLYTVGDYDFVEVRLKGLYDTRHLVPLYEELPGLRDHAYTYDVGGDCPDSNGCGRETDIALNIAGERYDYFFIEEGSWDTGHLPALFHYYSTDQHGEVDLADVWDEAKEEDHPSWLSDARACSYKYLWSVK